MKTRIILLIAIVGIFGLVKSLEAADSLLQSEDMAYLGSFTLPNNGSGISRVSYSNCVVGFNSASGNTLFVTGGHGSSALGPMAVAEVRIPESLYTGTSLSTLNSSYATSFVLNGSTCNNSTTGCYYELTNGNYSHTSSSGGAVACTTDWQVDGMVIDNGSLLASLACQYDAGGNQRLTLFRHSHTNLNDGGASYQGMYGLKLGSILDASSATSGGMASGAINPVPSAYQEQLGGKYLITGNTLQRSVLGASSAGPTVTTFDPANFGTPLPTSQNANFLLGYPVEHQTLGAWYGSQNEYWSNCDHYAGVVLPVNSRTVLVIGVHGKSNPGDTTTVSGLGCTGASSVGVGVGDVSQTTVTCSQICYANGVSTPACSGNSSCYDMWGSGSSNVSRCYYDPSVPAVQGPHCWPYVHQVWAYDVGNSDGSNTTGNNVSSMNVTHPEMNNLTAVRLGYVNPWALYPYAMWELPSHFYADPRGYAGDLGGAYGQIYGVSYDQTSGKLYAGVFYGQGYNDNGNEMPLIEVWQISGANADTIPPPSPSGLSVR